jgi:uncharacterized protein (DUF1778 family)
MIQSKNSRIDLRVTPEQKQLLEQAASIKGISLSAYTLSYLLDIAQKDITNYEKLVLSNEDRDLLLSVIENPPPLQGKLKMAIKKYRQKYE